MLCFYKTVDGIGEWNIEISMSSTLEECAIVAFRDVLSKREKHESEYETTLSNAFPKSVVDFSEMLRGPGTPNAAKLCGVTAMMGGGESIRIHHSGKRILFFEDSNFGTIYNLGPKTVILETTKNLYELKPGELKKLSVPHVIGIIPKCTRILVMEYTLRR